MDVRQTPWRFHAAPTPARARRRALVAGLVLTVALVSSLGLDRFANGGRGAAALAATALDPMALFAKRSPGARATGPLMQTKHPRQGQSLADKGGPKPPPIPDGAIDTSDEPKADVPIAVGPVADIMVPPVGDVSTSLPLGPLGETPPVPTADNFVIMPGGPGGGGGGIDTGGGPLTTTTDTPAVPEPSVWATLIVGFFGIGWAMRLERRRRRAQLGA